MTRLTLLLASAALVGGTSFAALAQTATSLESGRDTVDPAVPTQLPRTAIPSRYTIAVTPNAERLTFEASAAIDLRIVQATDRLVLNAADLNIASASLTAAGGGALPAQVSTDAQAQTATFAFGRTLPPGNYRLDIRYSGKINQQANGLFALDYKNIEGKDARALFTQFEAPDARRFVPSWDEPDYKARFDLTATVPAGQMAVSNMPAASTRDVGNGLKQVTFQTSPVMSTYLLFFGLGDFERITKQAAGTEVGIVMSRGNAGKARYALDAEAQVVPYFNDYFGYDYPLPKLDNVAGPGQSQFFGAMENWGAIFTFERILLVDPAITTEADRQRIFSVQAHEVAHQWFGNLVTMAWWDDLWLNEGFASWMASKTTQHFHPDWAADVDQVASREDAMALDSFVTTHPVIQEIRTVEQTNQAFDAIAYKKGQSVIAMLEGYAGADVWRSGIRNYIDKFAYKNTRTSDLWQAVENAGAKGLTAVARDFTTQPGIPLIELGASQCVSGQTVVPFRQSQFSNDRRADALARPLSWNVPLRATAGGAQTVMLTSGGTGRIQAAGCGALLINPGQTGYYRTLYSPAQADALRAGFGALGPVDQYGLLSNSLALSRAGYQPMAQALDLLSTVSGNAHSKVAELGISNWVQIHDALAATPAQQAAISEMVIRTFGPRLAQLGFVPRAGEPSLDALLRTKLIEDLGDLGEPRTVAEGRRLFAAWQSDPNAIPGSLKESWLEVIAYNADARTWDALRRRAASTSGTVERTSLYRMLGTAKDEALARRALELAITKEPGPTVSPGIISAVAAEHPTLALDFVLAHPREIAPLIDLSARSRFVANMVAGANDPTLIPKLQTYAEANLGPADRKPVERSIGQIQWRAENEPRIRAETLDWLNARGGKASALSGERG
ncbi:MAG: M1 family metallopeptidase [Pseudomonadota bacterium]|nr:M1 family metallopeptidase [Pseudomonadota bacterium]